MFGLRVWRCEPSRNFSLSEADSAVVSEHNFFITGFIVRDFITAQRFLADLLMKMVLTLGGLGKPILFYHFPFWFYKIVQCICRDRTG